MKTLLSGSAASANVFGGEQHDDSLQSDVLRLLEVQQALRARLLHLNFHAFARCMSDLLERLGYDEVELAGRLDWKGRNKDGGYDLVALTADRFSALAAIGATAPKPRRTVIVQLKQYGPDLLVHQRSVDELRGACLRVGASEGLLITTSGFSNVVQERAAVLAREKVPLAPVQLVDGSALLRALVSHRIGVKEDVTSVLSLDAAYFDILAETSPGNARRRSTKAVGSGNSGGNGKDRRNNDGVAAAGGVPQPALALVLQLPLQLPLTFTYVCTTLPTVFPANQRRKGKKQRAV